MRNFLLFLISLVASWQVCTADTITIMYNEGQAATVGGEKVENVKISVKGNVVKIKDLRDYEQKLSMLTFVLKGKASDGQFVLNTYVKAKVRMEGLDLTSQEGAPIHLKNKKPVELEAAKGTINRITITACNDTARNKQAAIWAKDKLMLTGKGTLQVEALGNGCRGINCKDDLKIEDMTLNIVTKGDNLGVDTTKTMRPPMGFRPDSLHRPKGMPMPQEGGMPPGKQKYISTCKGIKAKGTIEIASGTINVETNSAGAEGIEGKEGITVRGGNVTINATDDGMNSGGKIIFAGGNTTVISAENDAVDSNYGEKFGGGMPPMMRKMNNDAKDVEAAIVVSGGIVMAWSKRGAPEEGLDCDFAPIEVSGGVLFTIGAGMGEMPSVPTEKTAKQATALLIGVNFSEGQQVKLTDKAGKTLIDFKAPFDFARSSSLVSCPAFKMGNTYTLTSGKDTKVFELNKKFTTIR